MKYLALLKILKITTVLFILSPSMVQADIAGLRVEGNTISWDFTGTWVAVQDSVSYETLEGCSGYITSCTVPDGVYQVVDPFNMNRQEQIRVLNESIGNGVIVYPSEGWYQVLDANTFQSICEGGTFCTVPLGTWIVINHTTGERTIEVVTGGGNGMVQADIAGLRVEGNTISWDFTGTWVAVQDSVSYETLEGCSGYITSCTVPDGVYQVVDPFNMNRQEQIRVLNESIGNGVIVYPGEGWYQVQDANTFQSICEGGTSCTVPPGTWIVINHTTGERTIEVVTGGGGDPVEPPVNPGVVTVEGNTITMPGNAWYQVQNKTDLSTVCEGVMECVVSNGVYTVINHTTGQRDEFTIGSKVNADNAFDLIKQALEVITFDAYDSRIFADFNTDDLTLVSASAEGFSGSGTYSCSNGGTAELLLTESGTTTVNPSDRWTYDNCVVNGETRNGKVSRYYDPNIDTSFYIYTFNNYEVEIESSGFMAVQGTFRGNFDYYQNGSTPALSSFSTDLLYRVDYVFTTEGRTLTVNDNSTRFRQSRPFEDEFDRFDGFSQQLVGTFVMSPTFSNDSFSVTSDMDGSLSSIGKASEVQLQTGSMRISSDSDGSYVELVPDTGDVKTVAVRIGTGNPTVVQETVYRWTDLPFYNVLVN